MIRFLITLIFLILYFIISVPIMLVELIIQKFNMNLRNTTSLAWVQFGLKAVCLITGSKLTVNGCENVPKDKGALFIGNHTSIFDIIFTYPLMKGPTGYISKKEIRSIPFLGWIMYFVNCIFLDRDDPRDGLKMVLKSVEHINNGISIFLFPEGTRSKTGELLEFKDASFKIAAKSKCIVVPVAITGTSDIFENHFPWIKPSNVTITFGEPIDTSEWDKKEFKSLCSMTRERIAAMLEQQ